MFWTGHNNTEDTKDIGDEDKKTNYSLLQMCPFLH
jgi:hypothetical protein